MKCSALPLAALLLTLPVSCSVVQPIRDAQNLRSAVPPTFEPRSIRNTGITASSLQAEAVF